jgi:hypothetical protein
MMIDGVIIDRPSMIGSSVHQWLLSPVEVVARRL